MQAKSQPNPIEIKVSTVVAMAVILHDTNLAVLDAALVKLTAHSSDYYSQECAVIDVVDVDCATINWPELIDLFKARGFRPVAVRNASEKYEEQITELGLSIDFGGKTTSHSTLDFAEAAASITKIIPEPIKPALISAAAPMVIDTPVRGGQRIYARGTDLIITAVVNNGAEVIADGNIHIYAPLRGRALAGASGNTAARIFTMSLEAELVSIAGIYRTFEHGYPADPEFPLQIQLNGDKIDVVSIQSSN